MKKLEIVKHNKLTIYRSNSVYFVMGEKFTAILSLIAYLNNWTINCVSQ